MILRLETLEDARLDAYARLTDTQLRNKLEPEKGLFIAESAKVIERALAAGLEPLSLLMEQKWLESLAPLIEPLQAAWPGVPVFVLPHDEISRLAGFEVTRGALAAFKRPPLPDAAALIGALDVRKVACAQTGDIQSAPAAQTLTGPAASILAQTSATPTPPDGQALLSAKIPGQTPTALAPSEAPFLRLAVLEDITNPTNVGAIFRSAAALDVDAVLVTPGCCDPLYRRAVRVSMGTVFQVPWARIGEDVSGKGAHGNVERQGGWARTGIPLLHSLGINVAALALTERSVSLDNPELNACTRLALVLGTEGEGLADATIEAADFTVRIPMAHGVDSLNVAAASAVAFWQLRGRV